MSKVPLTYGLSWSGVLISVMPLVVLLTLNVWLSPELFPVLGAALWFLPILGLRHVFISAHRRGIALVKAGDFRAAIPAFQASYELMCRRPWVDHFRWLLIGSASQWTYREMALCNVAFCHGQIGEGDKMRQFYEKALTEFPGSVLAATALRMMNAVSSKRSDR